MSTERPETDYCILIADDDMDDQYMIKQAFASIDFKENMCKPLMMVWNYLTTFYKRGKYKEVPKLFYPKVILLDLNMPKKDGRECLKEIKNQLRN